MILFIVILAALVLFGFTMFVLMFTVGALLETGLAEPVFQKEAAEDEPPGISAHGQWRRIKDRLP